MLETVMNKQMHASGRLFAQVYGKEGMTVVDVG